MGKGDIKTRRGKIARGTYGVRRLRKNEKKYIPTTKTLTTDTKIEPPILEEKKVKTEKAVVTEKEIKAVKKDKTSNKKVSTKKTTKTDKKE